MSTVLYVYRLVKLVVRLYKHRGVVLIRATVISTGIGLTNNVVVYGVRIIVGFIVRRIWAIAGTSDRVETIKIILQL